MNNKKRFEKICRDIKSIKVQGARNVEFFYSNIFILKVPLEWFPNIG